MTTRPIRVLIAEDHQLLRDGLRALFERDDAITIIDDVADGPSAVEQALARGPDVVLMDVGLPRLNGVEASAQIQAQRPDIKVIILTMHDDAATVDRALRAGVRGFLVKGCDAQELRQAIMMVSRGEVYLHPSIAQYVLRGYLGEGQHDPCASLTPREREILQLIVEGNTSHEIADQLSIKAKTVQNARAQIMDKLSVKTTAGLVRLAMRAGITRP